MKLRAVLCLLLACAAHQAGAAEKRLTFTRILAHWAEYGDPEYLPFIDEARPELVQLGFYGGHFWSLAHTPQYKGYPAHFPVQGLNECGQWFEDMNRELHRRNIKVVGHFNVEFLVGDPDGPEGPRGFFKFYRDLWDEKELGPKPVENPLDLMERNPDGTPRSSDGYSIGKMKEYWGCLNNPQWRAVLKAWAKRGIQRGVDGYIANYFYRHNCLCEHCQSGFRNYLAERFTPEQLREQFGIKDLKNHRFTEIVGWHKPAESTPFRREMLRFSQISTKKAFDDVFIHYGRSIKPDLIVAQWDHLGDFSQISGDERCMLPGSVWGKGEDYLWYSTGASACYTELDAGWLGEGTLQARYIRGAFDNKPFTLGKYEGTRIRAAIAELAANGGAPMGFYTKFKDPAAREVIARYYRFIEKHDPIYRDSRSHAEAVLLYPRTRVHEGDVEAVARFKQWGRELLNRHVLFDVIPDDIATSEQLSKYAHVLRVPSSDEPPPQLDGVSVFRAPWTVRVSAARPAQGNELVVHLVNYNRTEPEKKRSPGKGIQDEKPIAVESVEAELILPEGVRAGRVSFLTPEAEDAVELNAATTGGRVKFQTPPFLVYGVVRIQLQSAAR